MTSKNSPSPRDESGFTLVELLVAMTMSMLILFGVLNTLEHFSSNASHQTRITDANEQVRNAMDRVVSDLRQAATIEVADADDLVYTVTESASTRRERICLDDSNNLWRSTTTTSSPLAPLAGGAPCPIPSTGGSKITSLVAANNASRPLFEYDSATPSSVRSVSLTVSLNAGNAGRNDISTLRASTFVRAKSETALDTDDGSITTTCNSTTHVPTLNLSASVGSATVTYTDTEGNALGQGSAGTNVTLSSATPTATTVIANITSSTGLVSQLIKTLECPS
jgi:type II secretory pathway pseudopilin PulG